MLHLRKRTRIDACGARIEIVRVDSGVRWLVASLGSKQSQKNHVRAEHVYISLHLLGDVRVGQQAADGVCSGIPSLPDVDIVTVLPIVARR
jgi:hypothetical protein